MRSIVVTWHRRVMGYAGGEEDALGARMRAFFLLIKGRAAAGKVYSRQGCSRTGMEASRAVQLAS
jgi:hypothetical protein